MQLAVATSEDGLEWSDPVPSLLPGAEGWDRRGRRVTAVVPGPPWSGFYDGRASAEENFAERTAGAAGTGPTDLERCATTARTSCGPCS